jgi:hypothetical protein
MNTACYGMELRVKPAVTMNAKRLLGQAHSKSLQLSVDTDESISSPPPPPPRADVT